MNTKPIDEYEKVIAKASTENKREIEKIYGEVISDVVIEKVKIDLDEDNTVPDTGVPSVVLDEKAYQQLTSTFVISDAAVFEISPLYFSLEIVRSDLDRDISSEKYLNTAEKASTKNQQMGIRQKYITVEERRLPRQK